MVRFLLIGFFCMLFSFCNNDERIETLLRSSSKDDVIRGAIKAGKSRKKKFVPLLLQSAGDLRTSTNFNFKGMSIYMAKMDALEKIFNTKPPYEITYKRDSSIINFYSELAKNEGINF